MKVVVNQRLWTRGQARTSRLQRRIQFKHPRPRRSVETRSVPRQEALTAPPELIAPARDAILP